MKKLMVVFAVVAVLAFVSSAFAVSISPTGVNFYDRNYPLGTPTQITSPNYATIGGHDAINTPAYTINGNGNSDGFGFDGGAQSSQTPGRFFFVYTFPTTYTMSNLSLWNWQSIGGGSGRGVSSADIYLSTDWGATWSGSFTHLTFNYGGNQQTKSLSGAGNANALKFVIQGGGEYSHEWLGFDEISFTGDPAGSPEANVKGNGVNIVDGNITPSLADYTDFGTTIVGTPVSRIFTVENLGTAALTTGTPTLPAGYTLIEPLSASIPASGSDTFTVQLDAVTSGPYSGQISFSNNDSDENPYNFSITGQVNEPVAAVAEPSALALIGLGLLGITRRRK